MGGGIDWKVSFRLTMRNVNGVTSSTLCPNFFVLD